MANTQTDLTTKQKLQNVVAEGPIKADPVKLEATEAAAKKLYETYDGHLKNLKKKIDAYSGDVKRAVSSALAEEIRAFESDKKTLNAPVPEEVEKAIGVITAWNKTFGHKYGEYQNGNATFANAKGPKLKMEDRINYEKALKVVGKYLGVDELSNVVADGKHSGAKENADYEKIQRQLIKDGYLPSDDIYDNKVRWRKKADGIPDAQDGVPGGSSTAALLLAIQKKSIEKLEATASALEKRVNGWDAKLQLAASKVPQPVPSKTQDVLDAETAVNSAITTDTAKAQETLTGVINTGNAYRDKLLFQLQREIVDQNERNVAVVALYQDKKIDFKAVKEGRASARDIHKLVEVLAGIEGRHKDYDQSANGSKEKSYRANVKDAKKEIEAKLAKIEEADKRTGSKTDIGQYLLSEAARGLDELMTKKNDDMVYSSKKKLHDFGVQPDLIFDSKSASLLADKLRFDNLFELIGIGKDESKKAKK